MAWLNMAREYYDAVEELFAVHERGRSADAGRAIDNPIMFMYSHVIELTLKAYIAARRRQVQRTHKLRDLYEECQALGLRVGPDDQFTVGNIIGFLDEVNNSGDRNRQRHGFRYFNLDATVRSSLSWTREVVGDLMERVSSQIYQQFPDANTPSAAAKLIIIVDKPVSKDDAEVSPGGSDPGGEA
ncbi:MAG: HEPN domain-containing protein [Pseudonocardiales bacterium]|nr:HEPN domain-containing protein [Pseudonocardiales bacterium]